MHWWAKLVKERREYGEEPVADWEELKRLLRKKYVPSHHRREMQMKLQRMSQGQRSVDEYARDLEMVMMRAGIREDEETTMSRFLEGLKPEVRDLVEMTQYVDLDDLTHQAVKAEQQLKWKAFARWNQTSSSGSDWKGKGKGEASTPWKKDSWKGNGGNSQGRPAAPSKPNEDNLHKRSRNTKCFKCLGHGHIAAECPSKRVMTLEENGELTSEDEEEVAVESEGEDSDTYMPIDGEMLMLKCILSTMPCDEEDSQR